MAEKKKAKKIGKEEKYQKLLQQIDLNLDSGTTKNETAEPQQQGGFTIASLLAKIDGNDDQDNVAGLKKQLEDLDKRSKLLLEPDSSLKQERVDRKVNYKLVKDDVAKWIPIIKRAREADHLDFTHKQEGNELRVNAISGKELKRNKIAMNIEEKLASMNLKSEKQIRAKEIELLQKVDPQEAKKRLNELYKQKMLMFQQEIKNKRIAKIKSKLYHKIKKRQKQRAELKEMNGMTGEMQNQEAEKLAEERALERIGMRHKTKSKHIQNMMKYADKKTYQQSLNDVNHQRQAILRKLQDIQDDIDSDEFDDSKTDQELKEIYIKALEKELLEGGEDEQDTNKGSDAGETGIKFIDDIQANKKTSSKDIARKLLTKLQQIDGFDGILSDADMVESDDEDDNGQKKETLNDKRKAEQAAQQKKDEEQFEGRKIYKRDETDSKKTELEIEMDEMKRAKKKNLNVLGIVKDHIQAQKEEQEENEQQAGQNSTQTEKKVSGQVGAQQDVSNSNTKPATSINDGSLTDGLNIAKLKEKFQKKAQAEFSKKELQAFNIENKEQIYKDLANFNVLVDDDNEENFLSEKYEDYEKTLPAEKKPLHGWGSWVGEGIEVKNLPTAEELARKKAAQIQLLKKQRADGTLDNVILNENRNKLFTQHLVKELPHQYKNKEQFEYLNNAPVGSEWTTMRSHQNLIKPKLKTQPGQIIQPASAPKSYGAQSSK